MDSDLFYAPPRQLQLAHQFDANGSARGRELSVLKNAPTNQTEVAIDIADVHAERAIARTRCRRCRSRSDAAGSFRSSLYPFTRPTSVPSSSSSLGSSRTSYWPSPSV